MVNHAARPLPLPPPATAGVAATRDWVATHLSDLTQRPITASDTHRGGDTAAQHALANTSLDGYAATRNRVAPQSHRGATRLSMYVRHGLLSLPALWKFADQFSPQDRDKFRDELLWQEYARHLYARLGRHTGRPLRHTNPATQTSAESRELVDKTTRMACLAAAQTELETTGFLTNQQRLWLASHFTLRNRFATHVGEDLMYRQLLDGSRAANRLGWQWVSGEATGRPYMFTRRQVEQYAPGICDGCSLANNCPIATKPDEPTLVPVEPHPKLRRDDDAAATGGPTRPVSHTFNAQPAAVWITAESLSINDPAVQAHPDLPVIFVFDSPLLEKLALASPRLVFLAETLADLALSRTVFVWRGPVRNVLRHLDETYDRAGFAATFTPVPGFATRATHVTLLHPWRWLRRPHNGPVTSFTAWRKHSDSHL